MMCVNDTLPPRARERWLLMTIRLSQSSLTGTERTEVAVGTVRLASMFWAVRAGAPRSTVRVGSSEASAAAGGSGSLGTGEAVDGAEGRASARGLVSPEGVATGFAGLVDSVRAAGLAAVSASGALFGAGFASVLGAVFTADFRAGVASVEASGALVVPFEPLPEFPSGALCSKKSHHTLSTLSGSRWYCSYISSTSHSFAPNAARGLSSASLSTGDAPFEDSATAWIASSDGFL